MLSDIEWWTLNWALNGKWLLIGELWSISATPLRVPVLCPHPPIIPTTRDVYFRTSTILVPYMLLCHH